MKREDEFATNPPFTCARAVPNGAFKKCGMQSGFFDGTRRNYLFSRIDFTFAVFEFFGEEISESVCRLRKDIKAVMPPANFLGTMNSSPNQVTAQYPSCYDSNICSTKLMRTSRSMSDQHELEERVKTAQAECERLRKENARLRAMLSIHDPVLEHPALG